MTRNFYDDISTPDKFVTTLELLPGREMSGQKLDSIKQIALDAHNDGRISAVSLTDNPGGNPALSPDALGREIYEHGMDVIVHFTCRDTNRVGMESRALQLAHMGMKNILALTGDYSGKGFGGRGSPVFDFDAVILTSMLGDLNKRLIKMGHSDIFNTGCAVSPFKYTEAETMVQYKKLERKVEAGASYTITQLGYDIDKYEELILYKKEHDIDIPVIASLYLLTKGPARPMNAGRVPGAHVSDNLLQKVLKEYEVKGEGRKHALERIARLGVVLKGIGYNGIHIGGIHDSFETVAGVMDRMGEIEHNWQDYHAEFQENDPKCFYLYKKPVKQLAPPVVPCPVKRPVGDNVLYKSLHVAHALFFDKKAKMAPVYRKISSTLDKHKLNWILKFFIEDPFKKILLRCQSCGDCGIQHVGFVCPESGCPKHTRNGACGGSNRGYCEVETEQLCVWVRAYERMKKTGETDKLANDFVPPRLWELKDTSSWINFHLDRDHQKDTKSH